MDSTNIIVFPKHYVCSALLDVQYLCVICTIVFHLYFCTCTICTFHFYFKAPLKNVKRVIPEEDVFDVIHKYHNIMNNQSCSKTTYYQVNKSTLWGIFVYLFLKVFSISFRSDSDSALTILTTMAITISMYIYIYIHIYIG